LFTDREGALAWLDTEREVLIEAVRTAYRIRHFQVARQLPLNLAVYLRSRWANTDLVAVSTVAREAAEWTGRVVKAAAARYNLGAALRQSHRFEEAIEALHTARTLYARLGSEDGESKAWNEIGSAFAGQADSTRPSRPTSIAWPMSRKSTIVPVRRWCRPA
jgi:tetratricopeptide (TPR) repeat protein